MTDRVSGVGTYTNEQTALISKMTFISTHYAALVGAN